ncbi:type 4a pilus biogenesis protein PilO [bacterium]|nr:type 4a pilus biogenesis protein PilO [bacterium]
MATIDKYNKAKKQLVLKGFVLVVVVIGWFVLLFNPISSDIRSLNAAIKSEEDSLIAVEKYKTQEEALQRKIKDLNIRVEEWDKSFPHRKELVSLAKELISYFASYGIELIDMRPSLFELYALEHAGNTVAGQFVSKQLLNMTLRGRYLNLGRMLERIDQLPFKVTVTDVAMNSVPNERPELEIRLDMFLYVHE